MFKVNIIPIQMGFFGAAYGWGGYMSRISYSAETLHNYTLPTEDPKNI